MTSREKILAAVLQNQPASTPLPDLSFFKGDDTDLIQKYNNTFTSIGGSVVLAEDITEIKAILQQRFDTSKRIVTTLPNFADVAEMVDTEADPHSYENVELAILQASILVAENGAVWFTDESMGQRIVPVICQHLAVVVSADCVVPTMHEAYDLIGSADYGFGGFIAGPSKTADIEQSLVLGAHGPLSMTVFMLTEAVKHQ